jgi:hypothetical protein
MGTSTVQLEPESVFSDGPAFEDEPAGISIDDE